MTLRTRVSTKTNNVYHAEMDDQRVFRKRLFVKGFLGNHEGDFGSGSRSKQKQERRDQKRL